MSNKPTVIDATNRTIMTDQDSYYWRLRFLQDWVFKLGLQDLEPFIAFRPNSNTADGLHEGTCMMDPKKNKYMLIFNREATDYTLMHEVGHMNLNKITGKLKYSRQLANTIEELQNLELESSPFKLLCNAVEDAFVDYHLAKYKEGYQVMIKKHIKYGKAYFEPKTLIKMKFEHHLGQYIIFYLIYNFILKTKDISNFWKKRNLDFFLNNARNAIRKENKKINIEKLNKTLDKFNTIKDTTNYQDIISFNYQVLNSIGVYSKKEVSDYLKKYFIKF